MSHERICNDLQKRFFAILDRPWKNLSNFWNYQASPIGITKRLMRMIIYEAHRGLYELTVYVSKTNKGHTRPTAATADARHTHQARSKKIFGNSSGCLLLFLAHYFVKFFNCEKFKTFSSCISLLAKLELFFVVFRLAKKRFLCSYHLRRCRAICA